MLNKNQEIVQNQEILTHQRYLAKKEFSPNLTQIQLLIQFQIQIFLPLPTK